MSGSFGEQARVLSDFLDLDELHAAYFLHLGGEKMSFLNGGSALDTAVILYQEQKRNALSSLRDLFLCAQSLQEAEADSSFDHLWRIAASLSEKAWSVQDLQLLSGKGSFTSMVLQSLQRPGCC